jgi:hypothetical protein
MSLRPNGSPIELIPDPATVHQPDVDLRYEWIQHLVVVAGPWKVLV